MHEEWSTKPHTEIAAHIGVGRSYVSRVKREIIGASKPDKGTSTHIGASDSKKPESKPKTAVSGQNQGKSGSSETKVNKEERYIVYGAMAHYRMP